MSAVNASASRNSARRNSTPGTPGRAALVCLVGLLSMFFAEVCSGSFPLWFVDWWGVLVTFPLYLIHTLFFLNLAFRTGRTSIGQLYLWGVLYGLYESWITKVTFIGYPGSPAPVLGTVAGIAIFEFCSVVLFWHPVFSFLLPVLVSELLCARMAREKGFPRAAAILPSHARALEQTRRNTLLVGGLVLLCAPFLANSTGFRLPATVVTILGSLALVGLAYLVARKRCRRPSIRDLEFGRKGAIALALAFVLLNVVLFFVISPGVLLRPRALLPVGIIVAVYVLVLLLLRASRPDAPVKPSRDEATGQEAPEFPSRAPSSQDWFTPTNLAGFLALYAATAVVFCLIPAPVANVVGTLVFAGMFGFSVPLFLFVVARVLRKTQGAQARSHKAGDARVGERKTSPGTNPATTPDTTLE